MRRTLLLRLPVCIASAALATAVAGVAAPAASADPGPSAGPSARVLDHLGRVPSNVPNLMSDGLPFGRKL